MRPAVASQLPAEKCAAFVAFAPALQGLPPSLNCFFERTEQGVYLNVKLCYKSQLLQPPQVQPRSQDECSKPSHQQLLDVKSITRVSYHRIKQKSMYPATSNPQGGLNYDFIFWVSFSLRWIPCRPSQQNPCLHHLFSIYATSEMAAHIELDIKLRIISHQVDPYFSSSTLFGTIATAWDPWSFHVHNDGQDRFTSTKFSINLPCTNSRSMPTMHAWWVTTILHPKLLKSIQNSI